MPHQPMTDQDLARTGTKQGAVGGRLAAVAVAMFVIGAVIVLLGDGFLNFLGILIAALAVPIGLAATGLFGSALVSRRSAQQKPFA